jgi:hypothetical protein
MRTAAMAPVELTAPHGSVMTSRLRGDLVKVLGPVDGGMARLGAVKAATGTLTTAMLSQSGWDLTTIPVDKAALSKISRSGKPVCEPEIKAQRKLRAPAPRTNTVAPHRKLRPRNRRLKHR